MHLSSFTGRSISCGVIPAISFVVLLTLSAIGGQSLRMVGTDLQVDSGLDNIPATSDIRVEGYFHDVNPPAATKSFVVLTGVGFRVDYVPPTGLFFTFQRETGNIECVVPFSRTSFVFRLQRLYNGGSPIHQCEIWDVDGGNYTVKTDYTTSMQTWNYTGAALFGNGDSSLAFLRVFTSPVPLGSKPPATADNAGAWAAWTFDGNGNDISGNGRNLNVGAMSYIASPAVSIVSSLKSEGTPFWAPFRPLRAGHPSKLDGTASYSMSDVSSQVACFWQQLEGPSSAVFDNRNSCTPTLTGLVFGPYKFRLRVRDQEGRETISDREIGAVAYDDNGVVIYPDERLYALLGPAKVLGASDWEWVDDRHATLAQANWEKYAINRTDGYGWQPEYELNPLYGVPRTGTVYTSNPLGDGTKIYGVGTNLLIFCGGRPGPSLSSALLPVINFKLSLGNWHSRRVDSCQSDTEITLRDGIDSGTFPGALAAPGVEWSTLGMSTIRADVTGTVYTDSGNPTKLYGVGTNFLAICNGTAGPPIPGANVRVLESSLSTTWGVSACVSNTELTMSDAWATSHIASPGVPWVWDDSRRNPGVWSSSFSTSSTANYYDVALANYRLYYRSGWKTARDSARWMAGAWWKDGLWNGAWRTASLGASMLLHSVDTSAPQYSAQFWPYMRVRLGSGANEYCPHKTPDIRDVRESAYCLMYMAEHAQLDPDAAQRGIQRQRLIDAISVYENRQIADGHWINQGADFGSDRSRVFTVANGSTTVNLYSGANIPADYCGTGFYEAGSIAISTGGTAITGTGTDFTGQAGKVLLIRGMYNGQPYSQYNEIASVQSATAATARFPWPGNTISAYRIQTRYQGSFFDMAVQGYRKVNADGSQNDYYLPDGAGWYWCTVTSGTTMTLDRPYTGTDGYRARVSGNPMDGSETYMAGLMATALYESANAVESQDSSVAARYRAVADKTLDFIISTTVPYGSYSTPYHSGWAICQPVASIPNICDRNEPIGLMRSTMVEDNAAFAWRYLASGNADQKTQTDGWFSAQFSAPLFASPFPGDGKVADLLTDSNYTFSDSLLAKSYGQAYGVGGSDMWPAARLGPVASPVWRVVSIGFLLSSVPNAVNARIRTTSPTGEVSVTDCGNTSPCQLTLDKRLGSHWMVLEYRSNSGAVLAASEPQLIDVP